jgi:O-acetyl-ADP-ribose deacetylase (regulator of RNase III)
MEAKKLKSLVVEIRRGDISAAQAGAIVNAANSSLWMGSGVAGAIKTRGGPSIEMEAMAKGPIMVGQAIETGAGKLDARYVIHAAVMGQDLLTGASAIATAAWNTFALAEKLKVDSIAMPALGTGVGAFPIKSCAKLLFETLKKFDAAGPEYVKRVIFVLYTQRAFDDFEEYYRTI